MKRTSLVYDDVALLQDLADSVILLQVHYTLHVLTMPAEAGSWILAAANHLDDQMATRLSETLASTRSYTVEGLRLGATLADGVPEAVVLSRHVVEASSFLQACRYAERADQSIITADEYRVVHISPATDASAPAGTRLDFRP